MYLEGGNAGTTASCFRTGPGESLCSGARVLQHYFKDGHKELYSLDVQPGERKDLAGMFPARVKSLEDSLRIWRLCVRAAVPHTPNRCIAARATQGERQAGTASGYRLQQAS